MNNTTFEKDIAATILSQIEATYHGTIEVDGEKSKISALKLMGASNFLYDKKSVQFSVKTNKNADFNRVVIKLNGKDLYDIELWNVRIFDEEPYLINDKVDEFNDIYSEQLGNLLVKAVTY